MGFLFLLYIRARELKPVEENPKQTTRGDACTTCGLRAFSKHYKKWLKFDKACAIIDYAKLWATLRDGVPNGQGVGSLVHLYLPEHPIKLQK
jgi:hypothetical protein